MLAVTVYIDGNNLHRSAKTLGFEIDYKRFGVWLKQKYNPEKMYIFLGFISANTDLYERLSRCGFQLIFKETAVLGGAIKGNCDAELVLRVVSDFYTGAFCQCILISGDGDFGCLVDFLIRNNALHCMIIPNKERSSFFLRNQNIHILFLNGHYHKFSAQRKKAPDADASA